MHRAGRTGGPWAACWIAAGLLAVDLTAATAWAQSQGRVPDDDAGVLHWGIAVGLAVVICAPAFLNPKRSHLT